MLSRSLCSPNSRSQVIIFRVRGWAQQQRIMMLSSQVI